MRKGPKPILFTTQEVAVTFWFISLIFTVVMIHETRMSGTWIFMMFMIQLFAFLPLAYLCYLFSKYTLNVFTDRIHHDYEVWIRCDKNGVFSLQIAKKGPLGLSKGIAHGVKAAIINRGDTGYSLPNGNRCILKYDPLSHNIKIDDALGWQLIRRKTGFIGYDAYAQAEEDERTLVKHTPTEKTKKKIRWGKKPTGTT
jgi:hypothetical protein